MKSLWITLSAAAAAVVPTVLAFAQDPAQPATRVETIPAHSVWVDREVVCQPAVMGERQVPVYETVTVPVVETRRVPEMRTVEEPVYATREVQAVEDRQVPVQGPVDVPVYESRRRPVNVEFTNPFTCCPVSWHLWDRCQTVCVGTRQEQGVVGWRTEQVPVTRTETYVSGTQTRQVQVGERCETVTVGQRDEQRCTGYKTESYVVQPAQTRVSRERTDVAAESVTVVAAADAKGVAPLPGTTRVVTEQDFQRALAAATPPAPSTEPSDRVPTPSGAPPSLPAMPEPTPAVPAPAPAPSPDYVPPMPHPERK